MELFEIITTMKTDQDARYSVVELCSALGVSRSGFYDHEQKPDCERRREDGVLRQRISLLFAAGRCTYGWRRIQKGLLREGIACGKKRIVRLMRDQELEVIQKRAFRPKTTQSRHDQPIAPTRLKALTEPPQKPNEVWCADITYIHPAGRWCAALVRQTIFELLPSGTEKQKSRGGCEDRPVCRV